MGIFSSILAFFVFFFGVGMISAARSFSSRMRIVRSRTWQSRACRYRALAVDVTYDTRSQLMLFMLGRGICEFCGRPCIMADVCEEAENVQNGRRRNFFAKKNTHDQTVNRSIFRTTTKSIDQSINQSTELSNDQAINRWINQSINQSIDEQPIYHIFDKSINQSINRLMNNRSITFSTNQSINQ